MKKDLTELVFVLDRSGSMHSLTGDTIGGFNSVLQEQKNKEGEVLVTTYLFNNSSSMLHDRLPIEKIADLTEKDYQAMGGTALIDCLGQAIDHIKNIHRYAREEDRPEHTIFVITTDGMENASREYTADQVRAMVKHEQEKYGWEFIYLAANIDAASTATLYGIPTENAVDYHADCVGTANVYSSVNRAVKAKRCNVNLADSDWREEIDNDYKNRKKTPMPREAPP